MARSLRKQSPEEVIRQVELIALEFVKSKAVEGTLLQVEPDPLLLDELEDSHNVHWIATFTSTSLRVDLRAKRASFSEMALNAGHLWSANYGDELDLMAALPWAPIELSGTGVLRCIFLMMRAGTGYRKFLRHFPTVRCEPLEPFYICRKVTGALTFQIAKDLLFNHGWHGANYGALLVLLAPKPEYLPLLVDVAPQWMHADRAIELAMVACGGYSPLAPDLRESHAHCISVREMLDELPFVALPLRPPLTECMYREYKKEREAIRVLYRTQALDAVKDAMKTGFMGYVSLRHTAWIEQGCPAPPAVDPEAPASSEPGRRELRQGKWPWRFW